MIQGTEQVNRDKLAKARRAYGAQAVDTMLRNGEVHRRFRRYTEKGRGLIDPTSMPENVALERALEDVFGNPQYVGARHFMHICTDVHVRRMKQYAAGEGKKREQVVLGDESEVRIALRQTKSKGKIAEMLAAEYQGRNSDARPRPGVLKAIMARLDAVTAMEDGKSERAPASDEELAAALSED